MSGPPKRRILVVEDHEGSREAIRKILALIGYEVTTVDTLSAGMIALGSSPSIILLDLRLPDGRGESILEKVRADGLPCRVIICTGDQDEEHLQGVHDLKPDAVLHKPVGLAELIALCRDPGLMGWRGGETPSRIHDV